MPGLMVLFIQLLGRKLAEEPLKGGCRLISKLHHRHTQESSETHCKNNHRDFSTPACALGTQWIQNVTGPVQVTLSKVRSQLRPMGILHLIITD